MSKSNAGSPDSDVLKLFTTDNCPFAHRFWIAALEKEDDPKNPKNFEHNEVNYFNYDLPTTRDFLAVHNTVPAGVWKGKPQRESMPMVAWADETFKTGNKLRASEEPTKAAIAKFTSGEFDTVGALFKIIMGQPTDENKAKLFAAYQELGRTVKASGGPYILGKDFTAADIAVYPFVERAKLYLPHFSKVDFPSGAEYADFLAWVSAVEARPSISITRADRLPRSMETHPFAEQKRDAYLIECAEYMPYGVKENFRKQLRFAPPGKKTKDLAKAQEQKKQEDDAIARVDSGKGSAADLLYAHVSRLYAGADKYIPLLADDAVWEAPFEGSIGRPTVHKGKADVSELVQHRKKALADFRFHTVRISQIGDNEAVAQLSALGRTSEGDFGKVYDQPDLVFFLTSKDGKISKVREFNDPARLAETFGYKIEAAKH